MANVVEILVTGKNLTGPAFAEADAAAKGLGNTIGKFGTVATAALVGVGVVSLKMATTFQSSMEMIHTQAGVAQNKIAGLSKGVLALAGQVGFTPNSLADALYHVESSFQSVGITGPKAMNLLKIAAEGAAVGHSDLVDTTNALDAVIASSIHGVKTYSQAMGVLNATVGSGDMKMQDLADAFGTGVLASVKGFGIGIKDVGAALAVFGDNNIRGAKAGTQLRMAVQALAAPTKAGEALLTQYGMTLNTLPDAMRQHGLLSALEDLHKHFIDNGVTAAKQGQIITEMFGKRAGVGIQILMGQLDRLKSKYPDLTRNANTFGSAWGATSKTLQQKLYDLRSSFDALMIEIGNKLLPPVTKFVTLLATHFGTFTKIAGAIILLGTAIKIVTLATKAWAIAQAILDSALLANPFTAIIAGVVLLAVVIIKYHKQIWDAIKTAWTNIRNWIVDSWHFIYNDAIQPLVRAFDAVSHFVQVWAARLALIFGEWAKNVIDAAARAFGWVPGLGGALRTAARDIGNFVASAQQHLNSLTAHPYTVNFALGIPKNLHIGGSSSPTGKGFAAGTSGASSGWAWVGEQGPELAYFHGGETVLSHPQSMAASRGFAAGTGMLTVHLSMPSLQAMSSLLTRTVGAIVSYVRAHSTYTGPSLGGFGPGVPGPGGGAPAANAALARRLFPQWGSGAEWASWNALTMGESGWNQWARNPSSGAFGIPQALPPGKMGAAAVAGNVAAQISWMVGYIRSVYGDPIRAYSTWLSRSPHWYDNGGWLPTGASIAVNNTGRPERILGPNESQHVVLEVHGGSGEFEQFLATILRKYVRVRGGNVQKVFGKP